MGIVTIALALRSRKKAESWKLKATAVTGAAVG